MQNKYPVFFKFTPDLQESPVDRVKKHIDAQIEYNKFLAKQILKGSAEEVCEIVLSLYIDLSKLTPFALPSEAILKNLKRNQVHRIINDIQRYQIIKNYANNPDNLDHLYLNIFITYTTWLHDLKIQDYNEFKKFLSIFYTKNEVKKIAKQIAKSVNNSDLHMPVMAEINGLNELLILLKPLVTPYCLRFINETTIIRTSNLTNIVVSEEFDKAKISEKALKFLEQHPGNKEIAQLLTENYYAIAALYNQKPFDYIEVGCINLFEKIKTVYQIEDKIKIYLLNYKQPIINNEDISIQLVSNPRHSTLAVADISNTLSILPVSDENTNNSITTATNNSESILVDAPKTNHLIKKHQECNYTKFYSSAAKENKSTISSLATPQNTLKLNKDHQKTYQEVFGLLAYDVIKLRDLVNLAQAIGGTLKTTGANRCRIELRNIYAEVLLNENKLAKALEKNCKKATIVMHGGGHRSTRSQNNDADKAPTYLIEQFKAAFIRAGYTPENLGFILQSSQTASISLGDST